MSEEASSATQARDAALKGLYELFPYPQEVGDLTDFLTGKKEPVWNPKSSFPVYFPEEAPRAELDILVAGCGTNMAPILAATLPAARVVGIDISATSLAISQKHADGAGLKNLELLELPLEQVASLGRSFDFVHCEGVLHHLADPVSGLTALGSVTRPEGALSVMVYGHYGRLGIYMLQDLCRQLGMGVNTADTEKAQRLLAALPARHPFRLIHPANGPMISLEEVADMLLNPRDVSYRVPDVRTLVESSGLRFHRWLGNAEYRPEFTALAAAGLSANAAEMDAWKAAEVAELCHGSLLMHKFVVTHKDRRSAEELFTGAALADAVPYLAANLQIQDEGESVTLTNGGHQIPVRISGSKPELVPPLQAIDGQRTLGELVTELRLGQPGLDLFRQLYQTDVLQLSTVRADGRPAASR